MGMIEASFTTETSSFSVNASGQLFIEIPVWLFPPNIFKFSVRKTAVRCFGLRFGQRRCPVKPSHSLSGITVTLEATAVCLCAPATPISFPSPEKELPVAQKF